VFDNVVATPAELPTVQRYGAWLDMEYEHVVRDNYARTANVTVTGQATLDMIVNTTAITGALANWPQAAQDIANAAGVGPDFADVPVWDGAASLLSAPPPGEPEPDTTAPTASVVASATGTTVNATVSGTDETALHPTPYACGLSPNPTNWQADAAFSFAGVAPGTVTVYARTRDAAGNIGTATTSVTVDAPVEPTTGLTIVIDGIAYTLMDGTTPLEFVEVTE
jgi:hypothetical protein